MSHEDDRASAETNRIAAESGRISAEGLRRTDAEARTEGERSRATRRRRVNLAQLLAYVLIVAVAAMGFYQSTQDQEQIDRAQACTERFLLRTVEISLERSQYAEEVQSADRAQNVAWASYVSLQLQGAKGDDPAPLEKQIRYVQRYFDKLNEYLNAVSKAEVNRSETPYPSRSDYQRCVRDADTPL